MKQNKNDVIIVTRSDKHRPWYWKIVAKNKKILAHSESYNCKRSAVKTAEALQKRHPEFLLEIHE